MVPFVIFLIWSADPSGKHNTFTAELIQCAHMSYPARVECDAKHLSPHHQRPRCSKCVSEKPGSWPIAESMFFDLIGIWPQNIHTDHGCHRVHTMSSTPKTRIFKQSHHRSPCEFPDSPRPAVWSKCPRPISVFHPMNKHALAC